MLAATHHHPAAADPDFSPKAKVFYDDAKFQVEFDVRDYRPDELAIKTEGDTLVVMAKHEDAKDKDGSSYVSRQFEQRFTLPSGVKVDKISSALNKDGRLVVTAPREHAPAPAITSLSSSAGGRADHHLVANEEGLPHPKVRYDETSFSITLDCSAYRPEELDVKVEGNTVVITAKQEVHESGGTRRRVFEQKFTLPSGVKAERISSSLSKDGQLTVTAPRVSAALTGPSMISSSSSPSSNANGHSSSSREHQTIEQRMDRIMSPSSWHDESRRDSASSRLNRDFALTSAPRPRSPFFHDANDLSLFGPGGGHIGDMSGGCVSRAFADGDTYKIVIDAKDFQPEELVIKTVGNTVHFEAKHVEKTSDGRSFSSRDVSQSFALPRGVDPESVASSLAKDGTLTISAPLPNSLRHGSGERLVPIKHH